MRPGSVTTSSPGNPEDIILDVTVQQVDGRSCKVTVAPWGPYVNKLWAIFMGGAYQPPNQLADSDMDIDLMMHAGPKTNTASIYVEEGGSWTSFPSYIPSGWALLSEAETADRIRMQWDQTYEVSDVAGDSQLSISSITGATRGQNVSQVNNFPQRGLLTYSITTTGSTHIVRFWAGNVLVAEGSRTGDGSVTCSQSNNSGMEVVGVLTYTGDITPGTALVQLRWPANYQIHYSTSPLSFPRTPEAIVADTGNPSYEYLTSALSAGTYYWDVLTVTDEGIAETSAIPSTTPKVVYDAPEPPTNMQFMGDASSIDVSWDVGEAGCTYTVYYSNVNEPINFDPDSLPTPVTTAVDATTATLAAITGYNVPSNQTAYDALASAFDDIADALNTAFSAGQTGFGTVVSTQQDACVTAITDYGTTIGVNTQKFIDQANLQFEALSLLCDNITDPYDFGTTAWKNLIGQSLVQLLTFLGLQLSLDQQRYSLPNGAIGNGALPSSSVGTGSNPSQSSGVQWRFGQSLLQLAQPMQPLGIVRVVVRATKSGVQETHDKLYEFELDQSGNLVEPRPSQGYIQSVSVSGLQVSIEGANLTTDGWEEATDYDIYVVAYASSIDPTMPDASTTVPDPFDGVQRATPSFTAPSAGWYRCTIIPRTYAGTRASSWQEIVVWLSGAGQGAVDSLDAQVTRGGGSVESQEST